MNDDKTAPVSYAGAAFQVRCCALNVRLASDSGGLIDSGGGGRAPLEDERVRVEGECRQGRRILLSLNLQRHSSAFSEHGDLVVRCRPSPVHPARSP